MLKLFLVVLFAARSSSYSYFSSGSSRIVGGEAASIGQFPHQVALFLLDPMGNTYLCGGSIIDRNWIITAGHCTSNIERAVVIAGNTNISDRSDYEQLRYANKSDLHTHPFYNPITLRFDVSLIYLQEALNYNENVSQIGIVLNNQSASYAGERSTASGFGKTGDNKTSSDVLMYTSFDVISNEDCVKYYSPLVVDYSNICVNTTGPHSTCQGDSGGPLVLDSTGRQIGLTSFGGSSCQQGIPTGFTRLSAHRFFIQFTTRMTFD